uniref:At1g61320/AtMIF1 LRR domain-containing protein n=1 Tax=Oryza brachyantha TaxID=4533 RepID=J3LF88_ORYBR
MLLRRLSTLQTPWKLLRVWWIHGYEGTIPWNWLSRETLSPTYDYLSLISLLGACPSLDTFILDVSVEHPEGDSIFVSPSDLRKLPEQRHDNLRDVKITGFRSAKSLVELTYYILKNTQGCSCGSP